MSKQQKKRLTALKFKSAGDLPPMAVSLQPTLVNKTGCWRALTPVIDYKKCINCALCWKYCPEICIDLDKDNKPKIILEYCKGCGICAYECPKKAIEMI